MATPEEIKILVKNFANASNSGFQSIQKVTDPINPTLDSLPNFDAFVVKLANAMRDGNARFSAFPQELIKCKTWNDLVTQIVLNLV